MLIKNFKNSPSYIILIVCESLEPDKYALFGWVGGEGKEFELVQVSVVVMARSAKHWPRWQGWDQCSSYS
jgi:hypothetical protein